MCVLTDEHRVRCVACQRHPGLSVVPRLRHPVVELVDHGRRVVRNVVDVGLEARRQTLEVLPQDLDGFRISDTR